MEKYGEIMTTAQTIILVYYGVINLLIWAIMGFDKLMAIKGKRRVPEAQIFMFAFLGGGIGGFLGMYTFRHKTRKFYFHGIFSVAIILHMCLLYVVFTKLL